MSYLGQIKDDYKVIALLKNGDVEVQCQICNKKRTVRFSRFIQRNNLHSGSCCGDNYYYSLEGTIIEDFKIETYLGKDKANYLFFCKCLICGLTKKVHIQTIYQRKGFSHNTCKGNIVNSLNDGTQEFKKFYYIWRGMRERTTNIKHKSYKNYGERGIVSEYYKNFKTFYEEQYLQYLDACKKFLYPSLERIDVNGNYEPSNLTWIEFSEQMKNRQNNKLFRAVSPVGKVYYAKCQTQFAKEYTLDRSSIGLCLQKKYKQVNGWTFEYL